LAGYIALVHKDEGTRCGVSFPDAIVTIVRPQRMPVEA
jgi:hypothetical protein